MVKQILFNDVILFINFHIKITHVIIIFEIDFQCILFRNIKKIRILLKFKYYKLKEEYFIYKHNYFYENLSIL